MLRPEFPHVPGAGLAKAAVLNHFCRVRWPLGRDPLPFPATSCARGVRPSPTPFDALTENGKPSKKLRMVFNCHPSTRYFSFPELLTEHSSLSLATHSFCFFNSL